MKRLLTAFFVWIAVYVAVTATLVGFQRAGLDMPLPVQTFLLTAVLVPTMIFILGPLAATLAQTVIRKLG
ncbi:antibiotic biosynthesis monooxygenase (ABM) superfamily enzyme [Sulfitobacter undariae]|uniref:Antibiotic biosynthesis monooxygenase (ABM) superfamily enzyme n=1 Tax=Sulfitobacter undariae TaxID=1563671 RepID=A0A7W6E4J1_9RHOB|nr:hypothetical protein [Sulfitobacter undariae]MBB3993296.1 antibiotic biosynthesis monooxygenase (ABM) superfamily enzyme [Sulfitobacter undariae]